MKINGGGKERVWSGICEEEIQRRSIFDLIETFFFHNHIHI